ncbi:MAG: hypothetical protein MNSN_05160 [Minisyncoccus archaeiphilus]|uniref:hypothetical protein n=1 Tax=Minisyncoccus archaeiphilus TaxID=3238481 RepID=UPI002B0D62F7|nr:MAG: hypothetical protein MNSN_05160 [Candidatus Parcubacteria bacterium]
MEISTKIDLKYAESKVIFCILDCSLDKNYSFWKLDSKLDAEKFISRLKHIEKMTWKQLASLDRKRGLTPEFSNSESFKMINEQDSSLQQVGGEYYYFHFRIEEDGLFRVFGYQESQFFHITHIDPKGKVHH